MPTFQSKKFRPRSYQNGLGALYRKNLNSYPFLLFGLPFIFTIVAGMYIFRTDLTILALHLQEIVREQDALGSYYKFFWSLSAYAVKSSADFRIFKGSFILTPATALRYERHDRKVQQMTQEEELGIGKNRRRVDINEEYYRLAAKVILVYLPLRRP